MRIIATVLVVGFTGACLWGGGYIAYQRYKASQPPSFAAQRFLAVCRSQAEAQIAVLKRQRRDELGLAQNIYHYADAATPERRAEYQLNMEYAQTAYDEVRVNGAFSKDGFLMKHADQFGRMDEAMARSWFGWFKDNPIEEAVAECMLNAKLAELKGKPVGDELFNAPPPVVNVPLKQNEVRVAFQNGCGAVVTSSASKSMLDDTVWLGACNFGLAHGKGIRQWRATLTPVTYYYGYDITPGQQGGDGATGDPAEIAARFKPLETARLQKLRAMLAVRKQTASQINANVKGR